jgi:hypothetical protein
MEKPKVTLTKSSKGKTPKYEMMSFWFAKNFKFLSGFKVFYRFS